MGDDALVIDLAALPSDEGGGETDPGRCWADAVGAGKLGQPWACGRSDVDALGLCAFHRAELFGLPREPDTAG